MKISEFVEEINKNEMRINAPALMKLIETKHYVGFNEKLLVAKNVIDMCVVNEGGYIYIDKAKQYIEFTKAIISKYTNLEFSLDEVTSNSEYDSLCENGYLNLILSTFDSEYKIVMNLMQMESDKVCEQNSTEAQVVKVATKLIESIDVISMALSNKIDNFDLSKFNFKKEDLDKLKNTDFSELLNYIK